jgi:divalent metal cation (Fe/Co/Zn/Cd) transporter
MRLGGRGVKRGGRPASTTMGLQNRLRSASSRIDLVRQAFRLEWITVAWMLVEAAVAIEAGVTANSISLLAFGIDSIIELASAAVLIWRLTVEIRQGQAFSEEAENRARRIAAALLFALALYVVASAAWKLWTHEGQEFSVVGLAITVAAIPIMYFLARRKIAVAERLGSHAMRADAVESIACAWLATIVVIGLLVQLSSGAWWVDSIASLAIVGYLVKEGREAWRGEE